MKRTTLNSLVALLCLSLLSSPVFGQTCVPASTKQSEAVTKDCSFGGIYSVQLISKGQGWVIAYPGSVGVFKSTSANGQCISTLTGREMCWPDFYEPETGSIYWRQRVVPKWIDEDDYECHNFSDINYTEPPPRCSTCGNAAGVPCSSGGTTCTSQGCEYNSPLLLDIEGDNYELTDAYYGVPFDISGDGTPEQISWTAPDSDDAWLVLDRNGNGAIDGGLEMFGDAAEQPATENERNGFAALAVYDTAARGGNGDGKINRQDAIFSSLRLWQDRNHDGLSGPGELHALPELRVATIALNYKESKRTDQHGNEFRYRAKVLDERGAQVGRWAWDVFLLVGTPPE